MSNIYCRHGHLMLFDDDEQLEVRHVVSLAHHNVSIYSGGDQTPEGELFIKRNALCLSRKADIGELTPDGKASKPFFLFSENCSDKEDFYFALLRNQDRKPNAIDNPPIPLPYNVKDIITLVKRLHSSEEHLQTRWVNAIIGRVFLALYKTPEVENFVRAKITKKISRVKTPSFLSKIVLRHIDMGEAAPVITNPRLKDLTVDGELVVEADMRYSGNFRLEVAATARIELGTRFKAREVNLLLAVVLKRIEGHAMIRIKPPPSNRLWVTFQTMPKIDMSIEPIVSSRQITYTLILRQIENRIKEVVAESLVYPNWDDSPFYHSEKKLWRGGIWADERDVEPPQDPGTAAAQGGDVDELQHIEVEHDESVQDSPPAEKSVNMPLVDASPPGTAYTRKAKKSALNLVSATSNGSSSSVETRSSEGPRALRSGSFASASPPIVSTNVTNADAFNDSTSPEHNEAASAMAAISALSHTSSSPSHTPVGSPSRLTRFEKAGSQSSASSLGSSHSETDIDQNLTPQPSFKTSELTDGAVESSHPPSPTSLSNASFKSEAPSSRSFGSLGSFGQDSRRDTSTSTSSGKSSTAETKRLSLAAVTSAAANAKKWGWNAIQRHGDQRTSSSTESGDTTSQPLVMGRGRPLPPPGTPLPPPDRKTKTAPIPVPKRKPIALPSMPEKHKGSGSSSNGASSSRHAVPPPPLPKRRSREEHTDETIDDGLLVVAAPHADSEPTTPLSEGAPTDMQPWAEDAGDLEETENPSPEPEAPRLPKRRPLHRVLSSSPEEDGPGLPSWIAAQEEEARAKSTFVDEDAGL
jgi:hypothetical protein